MTESFWVQCVPASVVRNPSIYYYYYCVLHTLYYRRNSFQSNGMRVGKARLCLCWIYAHLKNIGEITAFGKNHPRDSVQTRFISYHENLSGLVSGSSSLLDYVAMSDLSAPHQANRTS